MGFKKILNDGRSLFLTLLALFGFFGFLIILSSLTFNDPQKDTEILAEAMVDSAVPAGISWIEWSANNITNPWILLIVFVAIIWLFKLNKK